MHIQEQIAAIRKLCLDSTEITAITEERNYTTENGALLPPFIRVELVSRPSPTSYIRHEVWLPLEWNGIFLGAGNGGMAGNIRYERLAFGVKNGCATAHSDMGTSNGRIRGVRDPEIHADFGWRATALMTKLGKQITECFYGKAITESYFLGRSTGGQQALTLAQRYPGEYQAISAGVPGNDRTHLHTYFLWCYNQMHRDDGSCLLTTEEIHAVTRQAIAYCQAQGIVAKGKQFISQPPSDPAFLAGFVDSLSLTSEQKRALLAIYTGPVDPKTGRQIHSGMPLGSESTPHGLVAMLGKESPYFFPFVWTFGDDYDGSSFDFSDDMDLVDQYLAESLNANNPDLSEFFAAGGKLLMYSGSADACVPYTGAVDYFNRICSACPEAAKEQLRYFILPGQDHSAEIYRYGKAVMNGQFEIANNLEILRKWHIEGVAPECFDVVTANGETHITEPVCKVLPVE